MIHLVTLVFALSVWILPEVHATAGFAEIHSTLHYNEAASLLWTHPGDGCDKGKYCFHVHKKDQPYSHFKDLYGSFVQISLPESRNFPWLMGEMSLSNQWVVYDFRKEERAAGPTDYATALVAWRSLGLQEPRFAEAQSARGLRQTFRSWAEDWLFRLLLWSPLIVIVFIPLAGFTAYSIFTRIKRRP